MAGSMNSAWRATLHLLCRGVPAAMLLWAGLAKAFDHQGALLAVDAYDVLPGAAVRVVASVLPWLEIGIAVLLILGLFTRTAGAATAAVAGVFVVAMAQAKARGLRIDCGCFGGGGAGDGLSWLDILRDVPMVLAGVYLFVRPRGPLQLDRYFDDTDPMEGDDGQRIAHHDQARAEARQG
jgi:uncharacterized membrane protein YphA (DoxX/SURF4 family)